MQQLPEALQPFAAYKQFCLYKLTPNLDVPGKTNKFPCDFEGNIKDAHDRSIWIDAETAVVVFSRDMDGGALIKEALSNRDAADLQRLRAVYIADISGMPTLIARMFALPRMRKRAYPMLLDRDGAATRRLPDVEKHATLIFLDALRVIRIEHYDTAEALDRALAELPEGS